MEKRKYDVVIVGGGASGLAAAVELGMRSPDLSVLVIEKMAEPGRKIRATGSGRCNITNTKAAGYNRIMEFFTRIGLVTRAYENGLVYPYSESAADVAELLIARAKSLGIMFCCGEEVLSIKKDSGLEIESVYKDEKGEHRVVAEADYAVLATGGKAGPTYGTTGDGYRFARELGHSIVTPVPVLTGVECEEWDEYNEPCAIVLAGTRTQAEVSLYKNDFYTIPTYTGPFFTGEYNNQSPVFKERGEVQFTKYGLSGICVFNMTRHMRYKKSADESLGDFFIKLNLFPDGAIAEYIQEILSGEFSEMPVKEMLCTILKDKLASYVMDMIAFTMDRGYAENDGKETIEKTVSELTLDEVRVISEVVHGLEFYPEELRGWKDAQATSGGVSLEEIDERTSESKIVPGLYITGELADKDFQCGGFNLSNAWITGLGAADDIADKC